jgi:signal transduction histidine kinase/DNA-binding response OmpR family regulator
MLTGYGDDRVAVQAIKLGAADFFTKNKVIPEELIRSVCKIHERRILGHQLRRLQQQDSLIADIALRVRNSINLDDILNNIVQEINHFLMADRTIIYHFDPEIGGRITTEALLHPWASCKNLRDECLDYNYLSYYEQNHYSAVNDIYEANLSACHLDFLEKLQVCSYLSYPLIFPGELNQNPCFRLLIIHQCGHNRVWTEDDILFLKRLSVHVAIALQQAELYLNLQTVNQQFAAEITEHKKTQLELMEAKEKAELAAIAKGAFLANMSHEIRTPLNGVLGMLHLLASSDLSTEQQTQVAIAQSSGKSLLRLINDILDFSKIEAGKLEIEHYPFSLHQIFGESLQGLQIQAQEKGLDFILNLNQAPPVMLRGDAARLRQIITNLVGNAIKFTATGSVIVEVELEDLAKNLSEDPQQEQQEDQANCYQFKTTIKDSGIGIPSEKLLQLFQPFTQVDSSTTRQYGGTGLGLVITKQICELMGGTITMQSTLDVGSCVEFILPFEWTKDEPEYEYKITPELQQQFAALNILVVVANDYGRTMFCDLLSHWGAIAIGVDSKEQALECYQQAMNQTPFNLILIDQDSKNYDYHDLIQSLKDISPSKTTQANIILITNLDQTPKISTDYLFCLSRPIVPQDLYEILERILTHINTQNSAQLSIFSPITAVPKHHLSLSPKVSNKILTQSSNQVTDHASLSLQSPQNLHILLFEDNRVNQIVAKSLINKQGFNVDIAEDGLEGLEKLLNSPVHMPYALILMDCLMPKMDGYETTRQIRAGNAGDRYRNIPIIALTANAMKEDQAKCLAAGMDDYLSKPINPPKLEAKLRLFTELNSAVDLVND